ncbi:uncharacterized protein YuzE [Nocardioides daedukensis]|uniref:Uncharacterized protein YuzE n=1 Tax=Nocardioides daedukensis TaxID=634462 RepID=A0A7Y9S1H2_9ACTN|nr:DUF2283 domain-containing protein [Nocardioides daedukensis]NYG58757.1 uncharacterized protein YuzE [Nocardioides daedukensis]
MSDIRVSYDESANAAYIELTDIGAGDSAQMYACDPVAVGGMINLDFNSEGRLIGIEVLDARRMLPVELLRPDGAQ